MGAAGHLLDDMLEIIGLHRSQVYIANIVKCRPPHNRDPLNTEQDACIAYLRAQVALIQPKIIVCLGRIAAMRLIRSISKLPGSTANGRKKGGVQMMAIYHPSALLRDPDKRPDTFEDLKALQRQIPPSAPIRIAKHRVQDSPLPKEISPKGKLCGAESPQFVRAGQKIP